MSTQLALLAGYTNYTILPDGVDFDGTNDYLSKGSDLAGNADGKTFTFSAWVWYGAAGVIYTSGSNANFYVATTSQGFQIYGYAPGSSTIVLDVAVTGFSGPAHKNTFVHLLVSVDMANAANRYVYVNDQTASTTYTTYTNSSIDFTSALHTVAVSNNLSSKAQERLAHVYLDYTYRDLSNVTNRRLFVTADLKPAQGQAALNPILYLPMTDPTQPGKNSGTGGDFTLTGTIARSGRGPNQFNVPYSTLNGSNQYLSRSSITGLVDGKQLTLHFTVRPNSLSTYARLFNTYNGASYAFKIDMASSNWTLVCRNAAATDILSATITSPLAVVGRSYVVTISVDLTSTSNRWIYVNGIAATVTWNTYTNDNIDFTGTPYYIGADAGAGTQLLNGQMGCFWFHTTYIDLSQASNLAKFVTGTGIDAKPVDLGANGELPTGTSPLIYLPMYGNNAGKNYGTGGDFTVNSGPYTGARGPNEFWGNRADFVAASGYLYLSSALAGIASGKTFSLSFWVRRDASGVNDAPVIFRDASATQYFSIEVTSTNNLRVIAANSAGTTIFSAITSSGAFTGGTEKHVHMCIDLANSSNRRLYVDGVNDIPTWTTYTNDTIPWTSAVRNSLGGYWTGSAYSNIYDGKLAEFYFTTSYIDFSQEANRLLFRDAFGNPTNLPAAIQAGTVPNPAIYMRFDPASFGTNSGTGGNFTVNGTITDGGQL